MTIGKLFNPLTAAQTGAALAGVTALLCGIASVQTGFGAEQAAPNVRAAGSGLVRVQPVQSGNSP